VGAYAGVSYVLFVETAMLNYRCMTTGNAAVFILSCDDGADPMGVRRLSEMGSYRRVSPRLRRAKPCGQPAERGDAWLVSTSSPMRSNPLTLISCRGMEVEEAM